jgi:hypothetical protein
MSFATHGFMFAGSFRATVREVSDYKRWFTYADDLNRLGLDMLQDLTVADNDSQRVTIAALFVRAHHSFQAALVLAEMGLLADCRVRERSQAMVSKTGSGQRFGVSMHSPKMTRLTCRSSRSRERPEQVNRLAVRAAFLIEWFM